MNENTIEGLGAELSDEDRRAAVVELAELLDASESGVVDVPRENALWRSPTQPLFIARERLRHLSDDELRGRFFVSAYGRFDGVPDDAPEARGSWQRDAAAEISTDAYLAVTREPNVAVVAGEWVIVGLGRFSLREQIGPDLVYETFEGYQMLREFEAMTWAADHAAELAAVRPPWAKGAPAVEIESGQATVEFTGEIGMVSLGSVVLMDGNRWSLARPALVIPPEPDIEDVFALAADLTEAGVAAIAHHDPEAARRLALAQNVASTLRSASNGNRKQDRS